MDDTVVRVAVLYADVSGSTRLFEEYGDELARSDIASCLSMLSRVAERLSGRVMKTIGDEVMCVFTDPAKAATAAGEMQSALREAGAAGRFRTHALRVKIAWHYGPATRRDGDLVGIAPVTAQQIIKLAKADEVLTSGASLEALPKGLKAGARFIDRITAEAFSGSVDVYDVPWDDEAELTQMAPAAASGVIAHRVLELEHGTRRLTVSGERPRVLLGRSADCDLVVHGQFASRHHATIEYRHRRFHLRDNSTNGTTLAAHGHDPVRLQREEVPLSGSGVITLGGKPDPDSDASLRYRCR
jgi:class 3 adenylate cyclase